MAQFQVDYIEERGDYLASSRDCEFKPQQRRCVVASNKYLINCLVLVQPDFEINEVSNSIIIVCVCVGGGGGGGGGGWGEGFAIEWGCLVILGSH